MNICEINPFIRFAERIHYSSEENWVIVQDCRIIYILSGNAELYVADLHYSLTPGSLFYCHSGISYNLISNGIECICFNFDLTQENNKHTSIYPRISISQSKVINTETDYEIRCEETDFLATHLFIQNATEYKEALNSILNEFAMQMIYYREACSGMLKTLITHLHRHSFRATDNSTDAVNKALDYIKANYNKPITNQMLSKITNYHENHLNRLFLIHTGVTVHKYILITRLTEAKKLLLNTTLSLSAIAENVGFNSNTYFSNYFKQTEGISPMEFRKHFRNKI